MAPPSPELRDRLRHQLEIARRAGGDLVSPLLRLRERRRVGMDDGLLKPGSYFPLGTSAMAVRTSGLKRAPLRGDVRVLVVLVDFPDKPFNATQAHFKDLFFTRGGAGKSVADYYSDVSGGLVNITGQVVGPYRMPRKLSEYAHGESETGDAAPNSRTLARDAAVMVNKDVDFTPYDNDHDGFVDAYVIVHAGGGAEATGSKDDIWSHKWVLEGDALDVDATKVYAYLTVPEDARLGVCCHEVGHLLFGWPDLYDADYSSEGLGNWCLMAGGSWNAGGDNPSHPSAWCKASQGWVTVRTLTGPVQLSDVKTSREILRLEPQKQVGKEYFLIENRQKAGFDLDLPGSGLLVYHVDDAISENTNDAHPKVALLQADGRDDLRTAANRGDAGDPYPGSTQAKTLSASTRPDTRTYGGLDTGVALTDIDDSGGAISLVVSIKAPQKVRTTKKPAKQATKRPSARI